MKIFALLFIFVSYFGFSQNQTYIPKFEVTTYDYGKFPSASPYNGPSEKLELSVTNMKVDSLTDLKPSYLSKYKILKFNITYPSRGCSKQATCVGNRIAMYAKQAFGEETKIGSSIIIDEILAKDLKTNRILYLQPINIKIKQ